MPGKDTRLIFIEVIEPFLSRDSRSQVTTNIDIIEQKLAKEGYYGEFIQRLQSEKEVYKRHWLDLCNRILAEIDKDGWCRLTMTKDEAMEMKRIFEELD